MPSRDIAAAKTPVLLGESLELSQLADIGDGTDLESLLRKHMADEARAYVELEGLINALDFIEGVAGIIDSLQLSQVYVSHPSSSSFPHFPRRPKADPKAETALQKQQLKQQLEQQNPRSQFSPYELILTKRSKQDERLSKKLRLEFHNNFANIRHSVAPLLDNWLVKSRE
ncbi:hypothetical protein V492_08058, partial [Pseudogymnoascus sp. VKM F-4246]